MHLTRRSPRCWGRESRRVALRVGLVVLLIGSGCTTTRYLWQATLGQLELQDRAQPIARVLATHQARPKLAELLAQVALIKEFGVRHGLAETESYEDYAELDRNAAVWVVTACEPLSFTPKTWWFPIVGSFPYLGWFDHQAAVVFADELAAQGWDTYVRGASAYSTLGWFRDPLLSTMLSPGPTVVGDLAEFVLHESVHATVHVPGQTYFNESVAQFISEGLATQYLEERYGRAAPGREAYLAERMTLAAREQRVMAAYAELVGLYDSTLSVDAKLQHKAKIFAALQRDLGRPRPLNNAFLEGFRTYRVGQESLARLVAACGGDYPAVVRLLRGVEPAAFPSEQSEDFAVVIDGLIERGCARH